MAKQWKLMGKKIFTPEIGQKVTGIFLGIKDAQPNEKGEVFQYADFEHKDETTGTFEQFGLWYSGGLKGVFSMYKVEKGTEIMLVRQKNNEMEKDGKTVEVQNYLLYKAD